MRVDLNYLIVDRLINVEERNVTDVCAAEGGANLFESQQIFWLDEHYAEAAVTGTGSATAAMHVRLTANRAIVRNKNKNVDILL